MDFSAWTNIFSELMVSYLYKIIFIFKVLYHEFTDYTGTNKRLLLSMLFLGLLIDLNLMFWIDGEIKAWIPCCTKFKLFKLIMKFKLNLFGNPFIVFMHLITCKTPISVFSQIKIRSKFKISKSRVQYVWYIRNKINILTAIW